MRNKKPVILAIDQSTSASKGLLVSMQGEILDSRGIDHQQLYPRQGWVEHNADEIYTNVISVMKALIVRAENNGLEVKRISITNQRETFVIFDTETGKPIHNAIVWQDRRGAEFCAELERSGVAESIRVDTGLKVDTYFPASKLSRLISDTPEIGEKLANGSALFGTIDTYLIYRLTGGAVYATDHTNASRTLLYNIKTLGWSTELLEKFSLKLAKLPRILESKDWFGDTDAQGSLPRRVPIYGVMGDSQAALFAQGCFKTGSGKVTFGTGSSILLNIGNSYQLSSGAVTALAWVMDGVPTYAFEGIINYSGATITWLRDQLGLIENVAESETLALSVPDSNGVKLIPAFVGLNAPYWRSDVTAAILGLTPGATKAHIVRAALESIAYVISEAIHALGSDAGVRLSTIHADGGATRNKFLMQFVSDLNQIDLEVSRVPELSAFGAVFAGMLGVGELKLEDITDTSKDVDRYQPQMTGERASQLMDEWKVAVKRIL